MPYNRLENMECKSTINFIINYYYSKFELNNIFEYNEILGVQQNKDLRFSFFSS